MLNDSGDPGSNLYNLLSLPHRVIVFGKSGRGIAMYITLNPKKKQYKAIQKEKKLYICYKSKYVFYPKYPCIEVTLREKNAHNYSLLNLSH